MSDRPAGREPPAPRSSIRAREILTAVGEVVYEWSIADDVIEWGENALDVLGVPSLDRISTGRDFAALLEPSNVTSRHEAVLRGSDGDEGGSGVAYQVQYSLLPDGRGTARRLWIEDIGRWYGDSAGRPRRAHGVLRVINERYEREQRLAFLSRYDELTGYFNRSHLLATLGEAISQAGQFRNSLAFLIVVARQFSARSTRPMASKSPTRSSRRSPGGSRGSSGPPMQSGDFPASKLGLVLTNCDDADMHVAAERFHAAVRDEVVDTEAGSVALTVSIGGVTLPRHGRTTSEAIARAQEGLQTARLRGNGHFVAYVHSPSVQARRRQNAIQSRELVAALNEGRIRLAFQPVVDITSRKPVFHEALARVEQPGGTLIGPSEFVELSERLGLIRLVDHRVLELALVALTDPAIGSLSINVSAATIDDSEWIGNLSAHLAGRADLARRLIVEITELAAIGNLDEAKRFVAMLHVLGCQVAIDDFGAGFSSFRNLRELDLDFFKIDGSFIENLPRSRDDQTFVKALADLAGSFGVIVVAEWVQDEETAALLAGWGVDCIQGNLAGAVVEEPAVAPAEAAGR